MRVLLAPVGTRGDVEPLAALGLALIQRGHSVLAAAPANFASFLGELGLEFAPGAPDYTQFMRDLQREPFLSVLARQVSHQFRALDEAAAGADAIVGSMLQLAGPSVAEQRGIPYYFMLPAPVFVRSDAHPPVTVRRQNLPRWMNDLAWRLRGFQWNLRLLGPINERRRAMGLRAVDDAQDYVLHSGHVLLGCEPALAPPPDCRRARVTVTGGWYLDRGALEPALAEFCDRNKPVFLGFGSMMSADPQALLRSILEAVRRTEVPVVIGSGWAQWQADEVPESCRIVGVAPFYLLFPKVRAAVHHGGAGTTAAAARAGIPQAIVPHFADQYYWGHLIWKRGLGPEPVPIERLTAGNLETLLRALAFTPAMTVAAQDLARRIDPAEGVRKAIGILENGS